MNLKVAVYNVEWMTNLFNADGEPETTGKDAERSAQLAEVVGTIDPDILGVVEGPDTTVSGSKSASAQLEAWTGAESWARERATTNGTGLDANSGTEETTTNT